MSWYSAARADWNAPARLRRHLRRKCDAIRELDGDARWRYAIADAWGATRRTAASASSGIYDARRADDDAWTQPRFDDAAWTNAIVTRHAGVSIGEDVVPFPHMVPRDIPPLLEERATPSASSARRRIAAANRRTSSRSRKPRPSRPRHARSNTRTLLATDTAATEVLAGRAVAIVVDFGRDVSGYPRRRSTAPQAATVDVSYCERLRDDGRAQVQRANVITSQNVHRYILRDGEQTWEKFSLP